MAEILLDIACRELKTAYTFLPDEAICTQFFYITRRLLWGHKPWSQDESAFMSPLYYSQYSPHEGFFSNTNKKYCKKKCNSCFSLFSAFVFLKHLIHVTVTSFLTTLTVVWDTLVKAHSDVISLAVDLPKAGIASLVQLVLGCPPNAQLNVAVVRMPQGGCKEVTLPLLRV